MFPRTANKIIKQYAAELGIEIVGEEYVPLDSDDWTTQVAKIAEAQARLRVQHDQRLVQRRLHQGLRRGRPRRGQLADHLGVDRRGRGSGAWASDLTGQYAAWNYFQSVESPENATFIEAFQAKYGADRPTSDPMEAAYTSLYLYKNMVEKAESFCVDAVNAASDGVTFEAPEGSVTVNGENHHIAKTGLIGQINADEPVRHRVELRGPDRARSVPRGLQPGGTRTRTEARRARPRVVRRGCRAVSAAPPTDARARPT